MVGAVVGLCCVALVGFAVSMGVGTLGVGVGWDLLKFEWAQSKGHCYGLARAKDVWHYCWV
jgi:hypothetical protein